MVLWLTKFIWVASHQAREYLGDWRFYFRVVFLAGFLALPALFPDVESAYKRSSFASIDTVTEVFDRDGDEVIGYVDEGKALRTIPEKYRDQFIAYPDRDAAEAAVQDEKISLYYIIPRDFETTNQITLVQRVDKIYPNKDAVITEIIRKNQLSDLAVDDPEIWERLESPADIVDHGPQNKIRAWMSSLDQTRLSTAIFSTFLLLMVFSSSGFILIYALDKEKENRVFEILRTSTTPAQFIAGKLLGVSLVVLLDVGMTFGMMIWAYQRDSALLDVDISTSILVQAIPFFLLGFAGFGVLTLGIASLMPPGMLERYEMQNIIRDVAILPLVGALFIVVNPNSWISVGLSVFPVSSTLLMPFRLFYAEVPFSQVFMALGLACSWFAFVFWVSVRFFKYRFSLS